jgi:hypothetical protein
MNTHSGPWLGWVSSSYALCPRITPGDGTGFAVDRPRPLVAPIVPSHRKVKVENECCQTGQLANQHGLGEALDCRRPLVLPRLCRPRGVV